MNPVTRPRYEWNQLPWRQLEKRVFKLQQRIYRASLRGDTSTTHRLQRLLMQSWSAKCLAVRRVTQDNQGKRTAGVDGVKSLTPRQRLALVTQLHLQPSGYPIRRVWMPKPGKSDKRPLGIPVMFDRALQALVKLALEPEWEAKFEPESFGFRPGRSLHDALSAMWQALRLKPKYVLDADICQCFDGINQQKVLDKVGTFPTLTRLLKSWLQAGVMDQGRLFPTETGVPQGGVASPLLAHIALWGLATHIKESFPRSIRRHGKQLQPWQPQVVIYADDFVILHQDRDVIQQCQHKAQQWLQEIGLELHPSKTRIGHSLTAVDGKIGCEFLGFQIRQYPRGKDTSGKTPQGVPLGHTTLIKPSQESIQRHYRRLVEIVEQHKSAPQEGLIGKLNPVIRGWCNNYSRAVSAQSFSQLKNRLYSKLRHWARRRHPHKSRRWIAAKYWLLHQGKGWRFGTTDGVWLLNHTEVPIVRHVKIKGRATPFDGNWIYWSQRRRHHPTTPKKVAKALQRQQGRCLHCGLYFTPEDRIEIHHIDGQHSNNKPENLGALHHHCHTQVHGETRELSTQSGTYDKSQLGEEPDESNDSRPVLKPSRGGDSPA